MRLVGLGWVGTHANVAVAAGQCYWIEIVNLGVPGTCGWFWQDGEPTNGRLAQDGGTGYDLFTGNQAFCLNIALGDAATCVRAVGACCLTNGDCIITTSAACGAQGGNYLGDDTNCGVVIATSAPELAIPDGSAAGIDDVITIGGGEAFVITDILVGLLITHTFQGDIIAELTGPNAAVITLLNQPGFPESTFGFGANNFGNPTDGTFMIIDDLAATTYDVPAVADPGTADVTGAWKPDTGPLSTFVGINSLGNWTLNVSDNTTVDTGTLNAWRLILVGANPCPEAEACCFGDGSCLQLTVAACNGAGGTPQGAGSDCDPNPCATANPGSCCFSNGLCNVQLAADCTTAGGIAGAPGSTCSPNPCPCLLGDANCDGVVNNFDIDPFVAVIVNTPDATPPAGFMALPPPFPAGATIQDCWDRRQCTCNINCDVDGVNNFDIDPFVACIVAGDNPCVCP
ncbi:MAG: proprotein convertase P-domain-containing protein [Phycisphaerales bacterium]|nr:proprotein convertase P-domain-containing protein [Phycisphaerales bacterium]